MPPTLPASVGLARAVRLQTSPSAQAPGPSPRPRAQPSLALLAQEAQARGQDQIDADQAHYFAAKAKLAQSRSGGSLGPDAALLHPALRQSMQREASFQVAYVARLRQIWLQSERKLGQLQSYFANGPAPARLLVLFGGAEAVMAACVLPKEALGDHGLEGLTPARLPAARVRGEDLAGRQFVAMAFHTGPGGPLGIVILAQQHPEPHSPWRLYNPQRLMPPGAPRGCNLSPTFPGMTAPWGVAGGPDAQAMLAALGALWATGHVGPYRLAVSPNRAI